ncbi:MAG: hypothetical protein ACLTTP_03225 [Alistipes ihumii]
MRKTCAPLRFARRRMSVGRLRFRPADQALAPADFDRVTVGGELRQRIERNFDRLETDYYQPDQVYWTEEQSGGWPGDKEGRTILALVLDARASGRTPLYLDELIRRLPAS